jgi:lipopolysaccharide transport system ATP-binding protein
MKDIILKSENISKQYRLGLVGTGTLSHDLNRWWHKVRGKEDPYLKIGEVNDRSTKGTSDYVWALQDINFEVERGEVLGIIGKNGAGKSTLLKILSKVTSPTTGEIKTRGRIASLLEVGTGFHGEMTGRENIYLNGAILGMTKKEIASKIDAIIDFSGCERYIDTPVKRYSSGMTVRLAFAVAAFLEPEILVVDEVLAVGDAEFQKKAIGKMQDISRSEGRTVLFVSHDMTAIRNLCGKTILLKNGRLNLLDYTDKVINAYNQDSIEFRENNTLKSKYVKDVYLVNENYQQIDRKVNIGDDLIIAIRLKENIPKDLDYCFIGVENLNQQRIFSTGTHLDTHFSKKFYQGEILYCKIQKINLIQGSYRVMIAIGINSPRLNKEVIYDGLFFEVINDNYFNNGLSLSQSQGNVVFKPNWELL